MYTIEYGEGNGYFCGCCRKVYDRDVEFDTLDEVLKWLLVYYVLQEKPNLEEHMDDSDKILYSVEQEIDEKTYKDITDEVKEMITTEMIENEIDKMEKAKHDKELAEKEKEHKAREARERAELKKLKEKYE